MAFQANLGDGERLLGKGVNGGGDGELSQSFASYEPKVAAAIPSPGDVELVHMEATLPNRSSQESSSYSRGSMRSEDTRLHAIEGEGMGRGLLDAAVAGDVDSMLRIWSDDIQALLQTTGQGNTCLHIAASHDQAKFCAHVLKINLSLLTSVNKNGETALVMAVRNGHHSLVTDLILMFHGEPRLRAALLIVDNAARNILHYAISGGHRMLALQLISKDINLSKAVSNDNESALYIAAIRNYKDILQPLLHFPDSADSGLCNNNALHAAVRNSNEEFVQKIMTRRPSLAKAENVFGTTPVRLAVVNDRIGALRVLLQIDFNLGYEINSTGITLLHSAARRGNIKAAKELLMHCPDTPYQSASGFTCLHEAVCAEREAFVEFLVKAPQLRNLINMRDHDGKTALHHAVRKCKPKLVASLLSHHDIDISILDGKGCPASWELRSAYDHAKTLEWNEVYMLLRKADPHDISSVSCLQVDAKICATNASRLDSKFLSETHTSNTAVVAILIAAVTFAAAFTLPGGYSTETGTAGEPVLSKRPSFVVFLVSDTLAMCSSFIVAFLCILARWGDYGFLIHYRAVTKFLMWISFWSTMVAFVSGLFTVLIPHYLWLAIVLGCAPVILPIATKLVGEWPILRLRLRVGQTNFRGHNQLLDIV